MVGVIVIVGLAEGIDDDGDVEGGTHDGDVEGGTHPHDDAQKGPL